MRSDATPKPRKKHEPVEARLLGTAGRCFIEEGFGFGIDDILDQSGVAKMSLFVKFQSKYGLIERLLEIAHDQWLEEISRASKASMQGTEKVVRLLKALCGYARDTEKRVGLISQALLEFPRTGKDDETHKKKDLVHEKARHLQKDLLKVLEQFCRDAEIDDPPTVARQILLLVNGYLGMEPLLGKSEALRMVVATAEALVGP